MAIVLELEEPHILIATGRVQVASKALRELWIDQSLDLFHALAWCDIDVSHD